MEITPIELIEEWREVFGLPVRKRLTKPDWNETLLALRLVKEEVSELEEAISQQNIKEIADAIGDLYFVVTQVANVYGLDPAVLIRKVYDSNMSKLCKNENEAIETMNKYETENIPVYAKSVKAGIKILRKSDNKVLKSVGFKEPDWDYLPENFLIEKQNELD